MSAGEFDGEAGQVENVKDRHYCMEKSWEARNNHEMNKDLAYNSMEDLANTAHPATKMVGAHRNEQEGPRLANPRHNDRSERAGYK
jgi:hypothetical protein